MSDEDNVDEKIDLTDVHEEIDDISDWVNMRQKRKAKQRRGV